MLTPTRLILAASLLALLASGPLRAANTPAPAASTAPFVKVKVTVAPPSTTGEPAAALSGTATVNKTEVTWDLDPYYSDVDLNVPLTDKPIPTIKSDSEAVIYRD